MRSSSTRQVELDALESPDLLPATSSVNDAGLSAPLQAPTSRFDSQVYAATARIAGRLNAANISEAEHGSLLKARQALLDKKLGGTITHREENKLEYIRWSLDRIEDAKYGHTLDLLEDRVRAYEQLLSDMQILQSQLETQTQQNRRKGR
jgi:hypothetical protein